MIPAAKLDFPQLLEEHFHDPRLFPDRSHMVRALEPRQGTVICEVGVGLGGFTRYLIDYLKPSQFIAIDSFRLHEQAELWGRATAEIFGNLSHQAFYRQKFAAVTDVMQVMEGDSAACLTALPDKSLDILYVDADHRYEGVMGDLCAGVSKVKDDGLLVCNDYTMFDTNGYPYGVVQAVNELIVKSDWKVIGFSLQHYMFCDIALRRVIRVK